jgi:plastocyanin
MLRKVALGFGVGLLASNSFGAVVSGKVKLQGAVPSIPAPKMDKVCTDKNKGPVTQDVVVVGSGNALANVIVSVKSGLPAGKTYPAPSGAVSFDQNGCKYTPHVVAVRTGQELKIINSDGITHNVHGMSKTTQSFNAAMPGARKEMTKKFDKEEVVDVKCDVHPWMKAYIGVFGHPFYAVTGPDGSFKLDGLEPGTYEIQAWHERLGLQTSKVTIAAAGEAKTADFSFASK